MFSETIRYVARGHRPGFAVLGELRFLTKTMYLHNGGGTLQSKGPGAVLEEEHQWMGLQGAAQISGLGASSIGNARQVTVSLTLDDATIKVLFREQETEVKGRRFLFWGQFYTEELQPLDAKFHIYSGIGDGLRMQKQGPSSRVFTLTLVDYFERRRRSAHAYATHADQQLRDPGSTGFMFVPTMVDKRLNLFDARN